VQKILFFILAGGYGERARPLSLVKPKPLFPFFGSPLIKLIIEQLKRAGLNKGFTNLHYKPEDIKKNLDPISEIDITYFYEERLSGSKILRNSRPHLNQSKPFLLLVNGDVWLEITKNLIEQMIKKLSITCADGVILVRRIKSGEYNSVIIKDGLFQGRRRIRKNINLYTGVSIFNQKVINQIDEINFFDTLEKKRLKIATLFYDGLWLDTGDPGLYFLSNEKYKRHIKKEATINSLSHGVAISTDSVVKKSIIWENTKILNNSLISECIITGSLTLSNVKYSKKIIYPVGNDIYIEDLKIP
jgi:NDP-sugar pyrophosphorylase family protein